MSDAGYTLTEVLTALAVIGMATGALSLGMQVIGSQQGAVGQSVLKSQVTRAAQAWLEDRFADHAPFRAIDPERFAGGARGFRFDCGQAGTCSAQLMQAEGRDRLEISKGAGASMVVPLPGEGPARFVYRGAGEPGAAWPPGGGARDALRLVSLLQREGPSERVLLTARVSVEQPLDCAFDPVIQDCR